MLLADADLIVSNGVGLDDFLQKLLESGTGGQTPQLVLGDGIPTLTVDGEANPHFWLDPSLVAQYYVPAIIGALSTIDPAHGADYGANGDGICRAARRTRPRSCRTSWRPSRRRTASSSPSTTRSRILPGTTASSSSASILQNVGAEASAAELAALVEKVRSAGVQAVFSEAQFNPELAQTLADEAGITHRRHQPVHRRPGCCARGHVPGPDALRHRADRHRPPMTDAPAAISLDDVSAGYGDRLALNDVRCGSQPGRCWPWSDRTGPARAPCSRSWPGCCDPSRARCTVLGEPVGRAARRVAYLPQAEAVDWQFPVAVADVVMMGRYPAHRHRLDDRPGIDRDHVDAALETVRMSDLRGRQIGALSGGQRRRVFLARALAAEPDLFLLDEPVTGVDATTQEDLMDVLEAQTRLGRTVVASTHDLLCAAQRFHQAAFINGRVIATGPANMVLDQRLLAADVRRPRAHPPGRGRHDARPRRRPPPRPGHRAGSNTSTTGPVREPASTCSPGRWPTASCSGACSRR